MDVLYLGNRKYKPVFPCGILKSNGNVYWLLSPEPVKPESWQLYEQQRFSVVPFDAKSVYAKTHQYLYEYARHIVCTNPLIEYRYVEEPLFILQLDIKESVDDDILVIESEPEYLQEEMQVFLEQIGASVPEDAFSDENQRALEMMQNGLEQ